MCVVLAQGRERGRRHVLELEGDAARAVGQPRERVRIVVGADDQLADVARAGILGRIEAADGDAERRRREREHAAELPAADAAHDRWPCDQALRGSGSASTASVCSRRKRSSTARSSGRERASIGRREQRRVDRARPGRSRACRRERPPASARSTRASRGRSGGATASARRAPAGASWPRPCPAGARRRRRRR